MTADSTREIFECAEVNCKLWQLAVHEQPLGPSQLVINIVAEMTKIAILLLNEKELYHLPNMLHVCACCNSFRALKRNRNCDIMVPGQK